MRQKCECGIRRPSAGVLVATHPDEAGQRVLVLGPSGSGKSTLVNDILAAVLANKLNGARLVPGRHTRVTGLDKVDKLVRVDQSPIGRTPP